MITDSYEKATSEFSHRYPPRGYWGILETIRLGERTYYRAVTSAKCKRCRKARMRKGRAAAPGGVVKHEDDNWHEHPAAASRGPGCPICGNPYYLKVRIGRYACLDSGKIH